MVSVEVPTSVLAEVVIVRVDVPDPVTVAGEKLAVAPLGSPLALSATVPLNPFSAPTLAVALSRPARTCRPLPLSEKWESLTH